MPSLKLKYMVEDYQEIIGGKDWKYPNLRPKYLIPDYEHLKRYDSNQLSIKLKTRDTVA